MLFSKVGLPARCRQHSVVHGDHRVPADWGQESQASSWVEAWNSACLSRCPRGERPPVELYLEPGVFSERCTEKLPLRDRKSTRLNSSHQLISYAVFCLKKKKK